MGNSAFYVFKSIPQEIPYAWTKVNFNGVEWNPEGTFNMETQCWTPGKIGVGLISSSIVWLTPEDGQDLEIHIFRNSHLYFPNYYRSIGDSAAGGGSKNTSICVHVYSGSIEDYFEIYAFQNTPTPKIINGDCTSTSWFSGHMIAKE